jgi:hypothetical protein
VKLVFARRALREIDRSARWWIEHRDARGLFEEELAQALGAIPETTQSSDTFTESSKVESSGASRRRRRPQL